MKDEEEDDIWGPHISGRERGAVVVPIYLEPRAFESTLEYMASYTPVARCKSYPYVFYGIVAGNEEIIMVHFKIGE
jgi:hypothetical protein